MSTLRDLYDDRKCADQPEPYDQLIDTTRPTFAALLAAETMCNTCPLKAKCWTFNTDEQWVKHLRKFARRTAPKRATGRCTRCTKRHDLGGLLCRDCSKPFTDDDPRHGQIRGYRAHKAREQDPCDPCKAAWSAYLRERRAKIKGAVA